MGQMPEHRDPISATGLQLSVHLAGDLLLPALVRDPLENNTFVNKRNSTWCWEGKPYDSVECHFEFIDTVGASYFFTWVGLWAIIAVVAVSCLHLIYTYWADGGFTLSSGRYLRYTWELEDQTWYRYTGLVLMLYMDGLVVLAVIYHILFQVWADTLHNPVPTPLRPPMSRLQMTPTC